MTFQYQPVQVANQDEKVHRRQLAEASNRHNNAKFNCSLLVTLRANQLTTTVSDARISVNSVFCFTPLTAHAAQLLPTLYVSNQGTGIATFTHASEAQTDQNFNIGIFG